MEVTAILGNPRGNSTIISSKTINNADIINTARRNAEELCKGKTWHQIDSNVNFNTFSIGNESTICMQGSNRRRLTIDLVNDESLYANKTLVIKDVHVVLKNSMTENSAPLDLLLDRGELMMLTSTPSAYTTFNNYGFPDGTNITNAGVFLKGNIIVNGLLR